MEVSRVVFRPLPCISGSGADIRSQHSSSMPSFLGSRAAGRGSKEGLKLSSSGFRDNGHIQYYSATTTIRCGGEKKEKTKLKEKDDTAKDMKKRLKLVKNLSKDLSTFSEMGFGLDPNSGLVDQVKGKMISEATELLLAQLQQLKMQEKELKQKRKEEKAKSKAAPMENRLDCEASLSSSSESSGSECGEVVDMCLLKNGALAQPLLNERQPADQESTLALPGTLTQEGKGIEPQPITQVLMVPSTVHEQNMIVERVPEVHSSGLLVQECSRKTSTCNSSIVGPVSCSDESSLNLGASEKKIEVCMDGKCKKSGGAVLLEEFQKVIGVEGVAACKCMGKCRDGPNIRVLNSSVKVDDSGRNPSNPLCIGVGLEDVGLILANFFGENQKNLGLAGAS